MESATQVQILDKAICISLCTNALGKGMNQSVPSQLCADDRADWILQLWLSNEPTKRRTEFKPALLHLKFNPVSHPAYS